MHINITEKRLFLASYFLMVFVALFFSMNVKAEEPTQQDIESAYDYYNNTVTTSPSVSGTATPASPGRFVVPSPPASDAGKNKGIEGLGGFADSLMQPVHVISDFLSSMAVIIGMTCIFASFVRYMQHRVNPLAHPIGTVITVLILGILLVLLPLLNKLMDGGLTPS